MNVKECVNKEVLLPFFVLINTQHNNIKQKSTLFKKKTEKHMANQQFFSYTTTLTKCYFCILDNLYLRPEKKMCCGFVKEKNFSFCLALVHCLSNLGNNFTIKYSTIEFVMSRPLFFSISNERSIFVLASKIIILL